MGIFEQFAACFHPSTAISEDLAELIRDKYLHIYAVSRQLKQERGYLTNQ